MLKTIAEFDHFLATHNCCGQFIKLDFALVMTKENRESAEISPEDLANQTCITLGSFVVAN